MEQEKSPFEEIFKKEEKRKEKEKEEGILDALDKQEKSFFRESPVESVKLEEPEEEKNIGEEEKYHNLIKELLEQHYFDEAISIIDELKEKFGI